MFGVARQHFASSSWNYDWCLLTETDDHIFAQPKGNGVAHVARVAYGTHD